MKEDMLEFDGMVTEVLPDGNFRVKLDNDHEILAYTAGKMRKFRIRTGVGDRVIVEMSPYDLQRGRITFRHKSAQPTIAATGQRPAMWRKRGYLPPPAAQAERKLGDLADRVAVGLEAEPGLVGHHEKTSRRLRKV